MATAHTYLLIAQSRGSSQLDGQIGAGRLRRQHMVRGLQARPIATFWCG